MTLPLHEPGPPAPKRSTGMWIKLFAVWTAGLLMWAIYIIAAIYVFSHLIF